jgi:hypothetical protein
MVSLSTLLIGQSVWAVNKLQSVAQSPQPSSSVTQISSVMGLTTESTGIKVGQTFEVDLYIQPSQGNKVQALDASINFNKDFLEISQVTPLLDDQTAEYPQNKFDNNSGKVWISTILPQNTISEKTTIARLTFSVLKSGSTVISLNFQKGKTTDSNIVLENETTDSLDSVQGLTLDIQP